MSDCKFCKIIKGDRKTEEVVWEDEKFIVLTDKYRRTSAGSICLIIPKEHKQNLFEINNGGKLIEIIKIIGQSMQKAYNVKGIRIWSAINKEAGQSIFHCHIHILPCNSIWDRLLASIPGLYDVIMKFAKLGNNELSTNLNFKLAEKLRNEIKI